MNIKSSEEDPIFHRYSKSWQHTSVIVIILIVNYLSFQSFTFNFHVTITLKSFSPKKKSQKKISSKNSGYFFTKKYYVEIHVHLQYMVWAYSLTLGLGLTVLHLANGLMQHSVRDKHSCVYAFILNIKETAGTGSMEFNL